MSDDQKIKCPVCDFDNILNDVDMWECTNCSYQTEQVKIRDFFEKIYGNKLMVESIKKYEDFEGCDFTLTIKAVSYE